MGSFTSDTESLVRQLQAVVDHPEQFRSHGPELTRLARRAALILESPFEKMQRLAHSGTPLVCVRISQDRGILKALLDDAKDGRSSTATADLASRAKLDQAVLETILEYLATQGFIDRISAVEYRPTKTTPLLLSPIFSHGVTHFHDSCQPALLALNSFLTQPGKAHTAFELGQNSPEGFYQWMETHPVQQNAFHQFMKLQFASLPTWLDVVDFQRDFAQGLEPNTPLFVDVGGGNGQQCASLLEKYPQLGGRIVLQDLKSIVATAITDDRVERMEHDFFTEQPVKHARAYYFRQIFHNHDKEACLRILGAHVSAMGPDSVLLIDDKVIPDEDTLRSEYTTALGVHMLAMFNALERRESQWQALLAEAGLRIKAIERFTQFGDSIIVVEKSTSGSVCS
ncbi:hypothetical protein FE257_003809 [Aspergillus nanangensis]|uniref:O-methyltransferase C-terminal domain-containing protein n=1 Tax=Aspergillus nanangensis TaxID=2582783 RepID=A0AAD4CBL7_ASPNN|nr:hypothetical protein FE257_003809 [Aspergillus nanangensis]